MLPFSVPGMIWHSDPGSQYGAEQTRTGLFEKGFQLSMNRVGTPTDNGYAERFVGLFQLAVAEYITYRTLGDFLRATEAWVNFSKTPDLMKAWVPFPQSVCSRERLTYHLLCFMIFSVSCFGYSTRLM
jgi:transposase InsO family protein